MAEDALLGALEEEARSEARRISEEALEASQAMLARAREEGSSEREKGLAELSERLRRERASRINAARTRASGRRLAVRHELSGRAVAEVMRRFAAMERGAYAVLLARLFSETKALWEASSAGEATVLVNPADAAILEREGARVTPDPSVELGVVFRSADGRVRFENTMAKRLEKAKLAFTPAINEMLFDDVF